jgi:hypothetical protein
MREQLRQARGMTVPELLEQASRDHHSPDASFTNMSSSNDNVSYFSNNFDKGTTKKSGNNSVSTSALLFDDYSIGSAGNAPGLGLRDVAEAAHDADSSMHDNEAFMQLDDDVAQLQAELARLRQQKQKILRSPLEAITATSLTAGVRSISGINDVQKPRTLSSSSSSPPRLPPASTSSLSPQQRKQQIHEGMSQIRASAQEALDKMWGSPFKRPHKSSNDSSLSASLSRRLGDDHFTGEKGDEKPRSNNPQPMSAY